MNDNFKSSKKLFLFLALNKENNCSCRYYISQERTKKLEKNKMTILQDIGHQAMKEDDL